MSSNSSASSLEEQVYSPAVLEEEHETRSRRGSQRRLSLNRTASNATTNSKYLEEEAYPGLDENEIEIRRTETRNTILTTLADRNREYEQEGDVENDLSKTLSKSYHDETQENALPTLKDGIEFEEIDPELVTWESEDDPANPRNWTNGKKWFMTSIVSMYTLLAPFASSMMSPAASEISEDFGITNPTIEALLISIFLVGLALGPLITAPISEMYGRRVVLIVSNWVQFAFNLGCALSQNTAQMCVFRFLAGLFGSAPLSIGAGCLGDMFTDRQRNRAIALYSLGPTVGPNISPIIAGFMLGDKSLSWRWPLYVLAIFNGVVAAWGTICLKETYAPKILHDKAKKLRKETQNQNLHTIYEVVDGETVIGKFYINIIRPLNLLATNPMVFGLGLFMAICYGCLYLLIVTFPSTWTVLYGFGDGISGLMYCSLLIGYMLGIIFFTVAIEKTYPKMIAKNNGVAKPEYRLPFLLASGVMCPIGLFWYGWSADKKIHWIMPEIGAAIFAFGLIAVFQTIQNYLIDMNPRFSASSIAAGAFFRSMMGFAFPLFITKMIANLGYGWSFSLFGFIGLATGIPFPLFVIYKGEGLRLWANKRMEREQAKRDAKNYERLQKKLAAKAAKEEVKRDISSGSTA